MTNQNLSCFMMQYEQPKNILIGKVLQMNDKKVINYAEKYKVVGGRRFLNEEKLTYFLPNDDGEIDRTTLEHNIFRYTWQGNFSSKIHERLIKGNTRVIDLGCGSGQWLIDMSLKYSLSTFVGIDICPIYLPSKPDNVAFLQHNLLDNPGIPFPDKTFDFVYLRNLCFEVTSGWVHVINEMVRVTNLNGCIEFANYDLEKDTYEGPILNQFHSAATKLHYRDGIKLLSPLELIELINRTNKVTDIKYEELAIPLGWGGKLGEVMLESLLMCYKGFKSHLMPLMELTEEEYDNLLENLGNECMKYKPCCNTYRVHGIRC